MEEETTVNSEPEQPTRRGFISRLYDQSRERYKDDPSKLLSDISNGISNIGSRLQSAVYSGSGGQYGEAWGNTAAGQKQAAERQNRHAQQQAAQQFDFNTQLARQQHKQGIEKLGAEQGFQFKQNELDRGLTRKQAEAERAQARQMQSSSQSHDQAMARLNSELDEATRTNDHVRAQEIQTAIFKQEFETMKLSHEQAQEILNLNADLNVDQQTRLYELMKSYGDDGKFIAALRNFQRAMSGQWTTGEERAWRGSAEGRAWVEAIFGKGDGGNPAPQSVQNPVVPQSAPSPILNTQGNPYGSDKSMKKDINPTRTYDMFWHKKKPEKQLARDEKLARLRCDR